MNANPSPRACGTGNRERGWATAGHGPDPEGDTDERDAARRAVPSLLGDALRRSSERAVDVTCGIMPPPAPRRRSPRLWRGRPHGGPGARTVAPARQGFARRKDAPCAAIPKGYGGRETRDYSSGDRPVPPSIGSFYGGNDSSAGSKSDLFAVGAPPSCRHGSCRSPGPSGDGGDRSGVSGPGGGSERVPSGPIHCHWPGRPSRRQPSRVFWA
jgi:hypothetical protein